MNQYNQEKLLSQLDTLLINQTFINKENFKNIVFWFEAQNNKYHGKFIYLFNT